MPALDFEKPGFRAGLFAASNYVLQRKPEYSGALCPAACLTKTKHLHKILWAFLTAVETQAVETQKVSMLMILVEVGLI